MKQIIDHCYNQTSFDNTILQKRNDIFRLLSFSIQYNNKTTMHFIFMLVGMVYLMFIIPFASFFNRNGFNPHLIIDCLLGIGWPLALPHYYQLKKQRGDYYRPLY